MLDIYTHPTPRSTDPERRFFERTFGEGTIATRASLELDIALRKLKSIRDTPEHDTAQETEQLIAITAQAKQALYEADTKNDGTWNEYYRLMTQIYTLPLYFEADSLFSQAGKSRERREMIDGVTGIHVEIIEDALAEHDAIDKKLHELPKGSSIYRQFFEEREDLSGVITEQTFLALLNDDAHPDRMATLGRTYDDLYKKVDSFYYHIDQEGVARRLPIQFKTTPNLYNRHLKPDNGISLVLSDYNRGARHDLGRILVKKHMPEESTEREEYLLGYAYRKLQRDLYHYTQKQQGIALQNAIT